MPHPITVKEVAYHRNGISGQGFHVILFTFREDGTTHNMVATIFSERGSVAILDADETAKGNIAFAGGNSWRGDHFEATLRAAIKQDEEETRKEWQEEIAAREASQ